METDNIYLIIGPSGSGKTTLTEALAHEHGLMTVWSYTTRPPRFEGEEGHIFVSDEEFDKLGEMCAYTEYNGYRYGVTSEIIDQSNLYVIDPPGVQYMFEHYHGKKGIVTIFLDIDAHYRGTRMLKRGDSWNKMEERLKLDAEWFDPDKFSFTLDCTIHDKMTQMDQKEAPPKAIQQAVWDYICMRECISTLEDSAK